jgi:hypothetical protein
VVEKDPETGKFVRAQPKLEHPSLRPPRRQAKREKLRRTIVRTIKLVNPTGPTPVLVEVPIEISHNNRGTTSDPTIPIRHYLEKGFVLPHEFRGQVLGPDGEPLELGQIFCAVSGCWRRATAQDDPENGTERCVEHEAMWRTGEIRYAVAV